ncbi:hypothetical protein U9M48_011976, partial [Paspalum notatum var. saurae]
YSPFGNPAGIRVQNFGLLERNRPATPPSCVHHDPCSSSSPSTRPIGGGMDGGDAPKRSASAMAGLPEDSLVDILARVPARSVYRSKCVAKSWRDLIEDPSNRKKLPQTLRGFFLIGACRRGSDDGHDVGFASLPARPAPLQIDSSLSFLTELPGIEALAFSDSCNGLLLFEHRRKSSPFDLLGYVVCNPATEHWEMVPTNGPPPSASFRERYNYLVFDPSGSSHFHLVQFVHEGGFLEDGFVVEDDDEEEDGDAFQAVDGFMMGDDDGEEVGDGFLEDDVVMLDDGGGGVEVGDGFLADGFVVDDDNGDEYGHVFPEDMFAVGDGDGFMVDDDYQEEEDLFGTSVHVYSSETHRWSHIQSDNGSRGDKHDLEGWHHQGLVPEKCSGSAILNGMLHFIISDQHQIATVDVQGATKRIIQLPTRNNMNYWMGPGCVTQSQGRLHYINEAYNNAQLFIWVLEDYDTQEWVLKFSASSMELFGKMCHKNEYSVVSMHPDGNVEKVWPLNSRK